MKKCGVAVFSHYVEIKTQELIQRIQPVTEEIFRCTVFHKGQDINKKSVMIETQSDALPEFTVKEMPEFYEIKTSGAGVKWTFPQDSLPGFMQTALYGLRRKERNLSRQMWYIMYRNQKVESRSGRLKR